MPPAIAEIKDDTSTIAWGAVIAGALVSAALTLLLLALGLGLGLSAVSPWSEEGISASTFSVGAGLYLLAMAMLSGTVGGYLAGRLRMQWLSVNEKEVYFRDTAHGLATWALATLLGVAALGGATTHLLSGTATGAALGAVSTPKENLTNKYVDAMLRADPGSAQSSSAGGNTQQATRDELARLLLPGLRKGAELSAGDRTYVARAVAVRTGLPADQAESRVSEVMTQAKKDLDEARKATMKMMLWVAASMLAGALSCMLGAVEGGVLRDEKWYEPGWRSARTH